MTVFGLKKAIELNEKSILQVSLDIDKKKNEVTLELKNEHPEHRAQVEDQLFYYDDYVNWELERQQRSSMLLVLFSLFEGKLKAICHLIEEDCAFTVKLKDLNRRDDISYYITYLEKVFGLIINPGTEKYLTPIKQQKIVRNIIAHQDAGFLKEQKGKIQLVEGLELIPSDQDTGFISIRNAAYLNHLLDNMHYFLMALLSEIEDRYKYLNKKV